MPSAPGTPGGEISRLGGGDGWHFKGVAWHREGRPPQKAQHDKRCTGRGEGLGTTWGKCTGQVERGRGGGSGSQGGLQSRAKTVRTWLCQVALAAQGGGVGVGGPDGPSEQCTGLRPRRQLRARLCLEPTHGEPPARASRTWQGSVCVAPMQTNFSLPLLPRCRGYHRPTRTGWGHSQGRRHRPTRALTRSWCHKWGQSSHSGAALGSPPARLWLGAKGRLPQGVPLHKPRRWQGSWWGPPISSLQGEGLGGGGLTLPLPPITGG